MWRGSLGVAYPFPPLSSGGASIAPPCPVSTSRSSNRTCGFPASGSPTDVAFRHTLTALPGQLHLKPKLVLESPRLLLEEVIGLRHSPDRCPLHKHIRSQAPSLHRRYPASRVLRACPPPHAARPVPHGRPVGVPAPPLGLPACLPSRTRRRQVLRRISLYTCLRHFPGLPASLGQAGGTAGCSRCCLFPGLLSVHSRFGPHTRRVALRPSTPEASEISLPTSLLRLLPTCLPSIRRRQAEATLVGLGLSPTEDPRLFTAH